MTELSLRCDEVLEAPGNDEAVAPAPLAHAPEGGPGGYPVLPLTVRALKDTSQVRDHRVLQNLLREEDRSMPPVPDFLSAVQQGSVTPTMRRIVTEWMLEVVHEQQSQPEVFALAVNLMDRFMCHCRVLKSQLQLLGSVCLLISSKIREPCPIPGQTLIVYTDHSITPQELKEWELLVLYKLQWEMTAITPLDYLDHTLPRLCLAETAPHVDVTELRRRTETILVVCATDYQFAFHAPSLMVGAAIVTALRSLPGMAPVALKDVLRGLQTVTHTSTEHIEDCSRAMSAVIPSYLRDASDRIPSPDTTCVRVEEEAEVAVEDDDKAVVPGSPEMDLRCSEVLANESVLAVDEDDEVHFCQSSTEIVSSSAPSSRSSSPLSAVDIFTEFNTNVLQAVFEQAESTMEAGYSILVS